jgi:hypothetical protein
VRCFIYNKAKVKFMHSSSHVEHYIKRLYDSHAQNTTALHHNIFLTGIYRLLVTNKEGSAFRSANNCQGQLQTPQSGSVLILPILGESQGFVPNCSAILVPTAPLAGGACPGFLPLTCTDTTYVSGRICMFPPRPLSRVLRDSTHAA